MQKAYMMALYELMQNDKNVISVLSDSGTDYDELMKREFPDQCINVGIAEQNQVGIAAGLAMTGKIPFVYTTGAFLAYRAMEFIRDDVCLQNNNVKIIGMGSGLAWSTLGPSHHTTEDISILRAIPGLVVLNPATPNELKASLKIAYEYEGPVYLRMGMSGEKEFYKNDYEYEIGGISKLKNGKDIVLISTGSILEEVMDASEKLSSEGMDITVLNFSTLKPVNEEIVLEYLKDYKYVVTVEEQNIYGGIGSIIAEIMAENCLGSKLYRIGLNDCFARSYGTQKTVRKANGLDAESIYAKIRRILYE